MPSWPTLATNRALAWPVAAGVRVVLGVALISVTTVAIAVTFAAPVVIWPVIVAAAASAVRNTFAARSVRPVLTR